MNKFETKMLAFIVVGLKEADAVAKIKQAGLVSRVSIKDGKSFMGTMDIRGDRINLTISNGVVKAAHVG